MQTRIQLLFSILFMTFTLPAQTPAGIWQTNDVIDERIDVHAQRSLMRLLKGTPIDQKIASDLLTAVKAGYLEGIYLVDQGVPAMRARKNGNNWWEIVPKGQLVTLMTEPSTRAPLIALPKNILADPKKTDLAIMIGWGELVYFTGDDASSKYSLVGTHTVVRKDKNQGYSSLKNVNGIDPYPFSPEELINGLKAAAAGMQWQGAKLDRIMRYHFNNAIEVNRTLGDEAALQAYETSMSALFGPEALKETVRLQVEKPLAEQTPFRQEIFNKVDSIFRLGKEQRTRIPYMRPLDAFLPNGGLIDSDGVFNHPRIVIVKPIPNRTTCTDFQPKLLLFHAAGMPKAAKITPRKDFRLVKTAGINKAPAFYQDNADKAKAAKAWRPAKRKMARTYRPKPGDVYLLRYPEEESLLRPKEYAQKGDLSHVGYIKSIKIISLKKEIWTTVDGGQSVQGRQAVLEVTRSYDPTTNILSVSNPSSDDQYPRTLFGWVDVDYIIE